jgi:DNA repair protein RecO (recombination protein O)
MTGSREYDVEGIVIRHAVVGERDRIVTLFTATEGKLALVARGALRPGSTLGPRVDMLSHGRFHCVHRRSLDLISEAASLDSFSSLKSDLLRMSFALYLAELTDASTAEGLPNETLFSLLLTSMRRIEAGECDARLLRVFELQLLDCLGFCPSLRRCVSCGTELRPVDNGLSAALGGAVCPECASSSPDVSILSVDALKVMRFWLSHSLDTSCRVKIGDDLANELEGHTLGFCRHILQRELKSREWLLRLRSETSLTSPSGDSTIARRVESG